MKTIRKTIRLYAASTSIVLIIAVSLLTGALLLTSGGVMGLESVTGAIWTSDPNGERVNGNLYTNAKQVYLTGGPHKEGAAGLADGIYYFQVTDPSGKTLLSTDSLSERRFEVKYGYVYSIDEGTHKWNDDTTRGYGIVVQLWPFSYTPNTGGVYKVWVTKVEHYTSGQGCFGFISALSKTDNFKVGRKLDEVPKYFELWVTEGISESPYVEFYVDYSTDGNTWITGQLTHVRTENGYDIFRYETTFALNTYIYWQFSILNTFTWTSVVHGPELIDREGIVNKEFLFLINGHKYNYFDGAGLQGWTIELYKDGEKIDETQTGSDGYYWFIGVGTGSYNISEIVESDEGWGPFGPTFYEFTVDSNNGVDYTFDFYNYMMLDITDTSDDRNQLSSFAVVFTPSNDGDGMYKFSSTNPGSFYTNVAKYGEAGKSIRIEVDLPPDKENAEFDSPNFILHHTEIGSTPVLDVHVYGARQESLGEWVPDWATDVTNLFSISATEDGKHVTVSGDMPSTGFILVTVHIDYQISGSLTWEQVQSFSGFGYTFSATVYHSIHGVTRRVWVD